MIITSVFGVIGINGDNNFGRFAAKGDVIGWNCHSSCDGYQDNIKPFNHCLGIVSALALNALLVIDVNK